MLVSDLIVMLEKYLGSVDAHHQESSPGWHAVPLKDEQLRAIIASLRIVEHLAGVTERA